MQGQGHHRHGVGEAMPAPGSAKENAASMARLEGAGKYGRVPAAGSGRSFAARHVKGLSIARRHVRGERPDKPQPGADQLTRGP